MSGDGCSSGTGPTSFNLCQVTDAGLAAALPGNTTLETLKLEELPGISGTGLGALAGAPLTVLSLMNSSGVTDAGVCIS